MSGVSFQVCTAGNPGAIGIVQLYGSGARAVIERLVGTRAETVDPGVPRVGGSGSIRAVSEGQTRVEKDAQPMAPEATQRRSFLADLGGIDEGLVVLLRDDWAQLMPHGGPRVMQKLTERLRELGATPADNPPARLVYPEASSDLEADMLATLARAASPAAIDALLDQPRVWRQWLSARVPRVGGSGPTRAMSDGQARVEKDTQPLAPRDQFLAPDPRRHLIDPPSVVLVGRANVGKSTLSNLVLGRAASITADVPGTTRDWVAGLAELPTPVGGLAVRWIDTPGIREMDDPVERRALELARGVIEAADVLIAVRDPRIDWAELAGGRRPDLRVMNKSDLPGTPVTDALRVSAVTGEGLEELCAAVAGVLGLVGGSAGPGSIPCHRGDDAVWRCPWLFCPELVRLVDTEDRVGLLRYCLIDEVRTAD